MPAYPDLPLYSSCSVGVCDVAICKGASRMHFIGGYDKPLKFKLCFNLSTSTKIQTRVAKWHILSNKHFKRLRKKNEISETNEIHPPAMISQ